MGIAGYFSIILRHCKNILRAWSRQNALVVDNLYFDCNSIIYDCYRKLQSEDKTKTWTLCEMEDAIIAATIDAISNYIEEIAPRKTVLIAYDGSAPWAKMEQQRSRRFKNVIFERVQMQLKSAEGGKKERSDTAAAGRNHAREGDALGTVGAQAELNGEEFSVNRDTFTTAAITPGTQFMTKLNAATKLAFNNTKVLVSGSDDAGEGEHKIFAFIRNNAQKHASETTIVYGLDADLIMLCLCHLHICPNLYILRETPEFARELNVELEPNKQYIMDIPKFANIVREVIGGSSPNALFNYVVLCFFLGNDFLPHFPSLNIRHNGLEHLIAYFREFKADLVEIKDSTNGRRGSEQSETDDNKYRILWKNLREFVAILARNEHANFCQEHKTRDANEASAAKRMSRQSERSGTDAPKRFDDSLDPYDAYMQQPMRLRDTELFIDPWREQWQMRYYAALHPTIRNMDVAQNERKAYIRDICINYLQGLEWVFKYYTGACPDTRWHYRAAYPPLFEDLLLYIPFEQGAEFFTLGACNTTPVGAEEQLAYVLPPEKHYLIVRSEGSKTERERRESTKGRQESERSEASEVERSETERPGRKEARPNKSEPEWEWAYCKYMWEAHLIH